MIHITDKQKCAGCTACMMACPKNAISMVSDEQGFNYPKVDLDKCINCGYCDRVCPFDKQPPNPVLQETYAIKHKDSLVLRYSTSGGFFTAISDYVLEHGGVVYGASFDKNMVVRHMRASTKEQRNFMRGSKYVQSDLGDSFLQVKKDLTDNLLVLFVGTPCQIAGLKSCLGKNHKNLICVDLICYGVASPLIFKEHLTFLSKKLRSTIIDYQFRPKDWGWHAYRAKISGQKKEYHSTPYTDLWQRLYYSRVVTRQSCNNCTYSNLNRVGDITIGDCRGIDKVIPDFGSYEGVSLVLVNTQIGKDMFESVRDRMIIESINIKDFLQPPLHQCSLPCKYSKIFFSDYTKYGYKRAISNYLGKLYPVKYYVKKLLKRK